jgi:hypothetical protein
VLRHFGRFPGWPGPPLGPNPRPSGARPVPCVALYGRGRPARPATRSQNCARGRVADTQLRVRAVRG